MKTARSAGNGSQISAATATATGVGDARSAMRQAQTYAATKSGSAATNTSTCPPMPNAPAAWFVSASASPSGSARQKSFPYARIVSATTCPTVRSAGGSAAGSSGTLELRDQPGKRSSERAVGIGEAPLPAVRLADRVREHAHLDGRDTRERGRAEHRVAFHRLDGAAARAAD